MLLHRVRTALVASVLVVGAAVPAAVSVAPAQASTVSAYAKHACTHTASGKCIRGGEFCPHAKYGKSGWDAKGRRYVCKGSHEHPHWEKP